MEYYDIIVIGAGLAGSSLVYNLTQECPNSTILLIDKNFVGSNEGYGYRIVPRNIKEQYKVPFVHKYEFLKVGFKDRIYFSIKDDFYLVSYLELCSFFLSRARVVFRQEQAKNVKNSVLITNKGHYKFKYLADCSGSDLFLGRILKKEMPLLYWVGNLQALKSEEVAENNSFYFTFLEDGFIEDCYQFGNTILQGTWAYTRIPFWNGQKTCNDWTKSFLKLDGEERIVKRCYVTVPAAPLLPLTYRNYVFLGDSAGNLSTSVGLGVGPVLESSKLLSKAIKRNDLYQYQKEWKKLRLNNDLKCIASKIDRYFNIRILPVGKYPSTEQVVECLAKNPNFFLSLIRDENIRLPKQLKNIYPKSHILNTLFNYLCLRVKYAKMQHLS